MKFQGIVKGTAATLNVCLGFIPRKVEIRNLTTLTGIKWATDMRAGILAETQNGVSVAAAGDVAAITTAAAGIVPYVGGTLLTAASTTCVARNDKDQRGAYNANVPISTFTIGSVANKTGNFNVEASTDVVGAGSVVIIKGVEYYVVAMTSNGQEANEVTMNDVPAGAVAGAVFSVDKIRSRYDLVGAPAGVVTPAGFTLGASATVNSSGGVLLVEAEDC